MIKDVREGVFAVIGLILAVPLFLSNVYFLTDILNMSLPLFNVSFKMTFLLTAILILVKNSLGLHSGVNARIISKLIKEPNSVCENALLTSTTTTFGYILTWIIIKIII